jgi:hypothetical protein
VGKVVVLDGSSRLGVVKSKHSSPMMPFHFFAAGTITLGYKQYELSNHLGNVLTTIADNVITPPSGVGGLLARIVSTQDYYPFGMCMVERAYQEPTVNNERSYRFGFNTQERDTDIDASGNHYTAEFWEYDSRTGRRWNIDPKPNLEISGYVCFSNSPILFNDIKGDSIRYSIKGQMYTWRYRETKDGELNGWGFYDDKDKIYNGTDATIKEVSIAITKSTLSPKGKEFIDMIAGLPTEQDINITEYPTTVAGRRNVTQDKTIYVAPDIVQEAYTVSGLKPIPFHVILFHEMAHAYANVRNINWTVWTDVEGTFLSNSEKYASHMENILRGEQGLPLRSYYSYETSSSRPIHGTQLIDNNNRSLFFTMGCSDPVYQHERIRNEKERYLYK